MHQQKRIREDGCKELSISPVRAQGTTSCDLSVVAVAYATKLPCGDVDGPLSGDLGRCHQIVLNSASALRLAKEALNLESIEPFTSVK